ncbi:Ppx/GppA phosphatase family protein [Actinokineospora sp. G85]|uniref:Ppx/GppA phosphatase family protein n=1 Tax=Actinokineospora sp. G85 TaxID=3406626 RepID=UPI003C74563B
MRNGTRLGVVDVGSNAAQLLVVDGRTGSAPLASYSMKRPTGLADEIEADGALSAEGVRRVVRATSAVVGRARSLEVAELFVFATSAVRDAANRDEVVDAIRAATGLRPQFLTGEDEARLTYHAVHRWYGWSAGRLLLLDIGGGTVEIVLGRDAEPELTMSLPLGAGRMTRNFLHADPPTDKQVRRVAKHVREGLREAVERLRWEGAFDRAIATSKTFKQLARLAGAPPQSAGPFARRSLSVADLDHWIPQLASRTRQDRAGLRGVSASRAGQIVGGAVVARTMMTALGVRSVDVCPWALREGIMLHQLQTSLSLTDPLALRTVSPISDGDEETWQSR